MAAIGVDFDGVIHDYVKGWDDGTIYGNLAPGSIAALRQLMDRYAVFVFTCRTPLVEVAHWLNRRTGLPVALDDGVMRFWTDRERLLVTDRKLPAMAYIDDRAIRFESWRQVISDLDFYVTPGAGPAAPCSPRP